MAQVSHVLITALKENNVESIFPPSLGTIRCKPRPVHRSFCRLMGFLKQDPAPPEVKSSA